MDGKPKRIRVLPREISIIKYLLIKLDGPNITARIQVPRNKSKSAKTKSQSFTNIIKEYKSNAAYREYWLDAMATKWDYWQVIAKHNITKPNRRAKLKSYLKILRNEQRMIASTSNNVDFIPLECEKDQTVLYSQLNRVLSENCALHKQINTVLSEKCVLQEKFNECKLNQEKDKAKRVQKQKSKAKRRNNATKAKASVLGVRLRSGSVGGSRRSRKRLKSDLLTYIQSLSGDSAPEIVADLIHHYVFEDDLGATIKQTIETQFVTKENKCIRGIETNIDTQQSRQCASAFFHGYNKRRNYIRTRGTRCYEIKNKDGTVKYGDRLKTENGTLLYGGHSYAKLIECKDRIFEILATKYQITFDELEERFIESGEQHVMVDPVQFVRLFLELCINDESFRSISSIFQTDKLRLELSFQILFDTKSLKNCTAGKGTIILLRVLDVFTGLNESVFTTYPVGLTSMKDNQTFELRKDIITKLKGRSQGGWKIPVYKREIEYDALDTMSPSDIDHHVTITTNTVSNNGDWAAWSNGGYGPACIYLLNNSLVLCKDPQHSDYKTLRFRELSRNIYGYKDKMYYCCISKYNKNICIMIPYKYERVDLLTTNWRVCRCKLNSKIAKILYSKVKDLVDAKIEEGSCASKHKLWLEASKELGICFGAHEPFPDDCDTDFHPILHTILGLVRNQSEQLLNTLCIKFDMDMDLLTQPFANNTTLNKCYREQLVQKMKVIKEGEKLSTKFDGRTCLLKLKHDHLVLN
eukprot:892990_1